MKTFLAVVCILGLSGGLSTATGSSRSADDRLAVPSPPRAGVVDRFLHSGTPPLTSYRAGRVLTASTMGGRMRASLEATTVLDPDGTFHFEVSHEEGSALLRDHVLMAALEAEQRTRNGGTLGEADLTAANYEFQVLPEADEDGLAAIGLRPRRRSQLLLDGTATVKPDDGDLIRVEGRPAKAPSWWTLRVDIVRRYARIAGVRVPVEMSSRADVRVAGSSTFSMTYDYTSINGQRVGGGNGRSEAR